MQLLSGDGAVEAADTFESLFAALTSLYPPGSSSKEGAIAAADAVDIIRHARPLLPAVKLRASTQPTISLRRGRCSSGPSPTPTRPTSPSWGQ